MLNTTILREIIERNGVAGFPESAFISAPLKTAKCTLCDRVTKEPMFSETCGHRYCCVCLKLLFYVQGEAEEIKYEEVERFARSFAVSYEPNEDATCICIHGNCRESFAWSSVHADKAILKSIGRLSCKCVNDHCAFSGPFRDYRNHYSTCVDQPAVSASASSNSISSGDSSLPSQFEFMKFAEFTVSGLADRVTAMRNNVGSLERKAAVLERHLKESETLDKEIAKLGREQVSNTNCLIDALNGSGVRIHEISLQLYAHDPAKDGTFVWRINNFSERMDRARREPDFSFLSNPFYTSPSGYKLRLRLFPNGYKQANGKFMSLFVVLCRCEFDAINRWPFNKSIELTVLDQRVSQFPASPFEHLTRIIRPAAAVAHQPIHEMNSGFGFLKLLALNDGAVFLPSPQQPHFVIDDVMFIRAVVPPFAL